MTKSTKIFCLNCWHEVHNSLFLGYYCFNCYFSWNFTSFNQMYYHLPSCKDKTVPDGSLFIGKELQL